MEIQLLHHLPILLTVTDTVILILIAILLIFIIHHYQCKSFWRRKIYAEIMARENDINRVGAELHDEIGPMLSAVKLQVTSLHPEAFQDAVQIRDSALYIDDVIIQIREMTNHLKSGLSERKRIASAIHDFAVHTSKKHGIKVDCEFVTSDLKIAQNKEVYLYRIVQEIFQNCIRINRSTEIGIEIRVRRDKLIILIHANENSANKYKRLRIEHSDAYLTIGNRVDLLKGSMHIKEIPLKGIFYTLTLPKS